MLTKRIIACLDVSSTSETGGRVVKGVQFLDLIDAGDPAALDTPTSKLMAGLEAEEFVYFTHSWRAPITADTAAQTTYIQPFTAAAERGNIFGTQFHPEKSGETGLKILRNFVEISR